MMVQQIVKQTVTSMDFLKRNYKSQYHRTISVSTFNICPHKDCIQITEKHLKPNKLIFISFQRWSAISILLIVFILMLWPSKGKRVFSMQQQGSDSLTHSLPVKLIYPSSEAEWRPYNMCTVCHFKKWA